MKTQSIQEKGERLVPWKVMRTKAVDVDKDPQRQLIEILPAGYIGRDESTKYPRQRWTVSTKNGEA